MEKEMSSLHPNLLANIDGRLPAGLTCCLLAPVGVQALACVRPCLPAGVTCCLLALFSLGCESETTEPAARPAGPTITASTADDQPSDNANQGTDVAEKTTETADETGAHDRVLRHAVFFSFKETSTEEDVRGVADAFAALPAKIDSIIDFQRGTNNSPEGLDDGFTHCFLLTFNDAAGRETYLPHPAHKGDFADVLRPHMKDVFVIDYWGTPPDQEIGKELKHAVFFKFKDDAVAEDVQKVEQAFAALPSKIDSIKAFEWGTNNSPEKHDDGFTHCFMVTFDSEEGRKAYLPHPDHTAFAEVLKPVLDKVRVLDFWEGE
jgi:hypothetical protein